MDISLEEFVDMVNFDVFAEPNQQIASHVDSASSEGELQLQLQQEEEQEQFEFLLLKKEEEQQKRQESEKPMLVFLKPAKSRDDQYEGPNFPTTMLCTPYKYDLKLVGGSLGFLHQAKFDRNSLQLELVDSESLLRPEGSPSETRLGIVVESVESFTPKEKIVRFALNWCSFHFRKRAFRLKVTYKQEMLYLSSTFHTYARRRDTPYSYTSLPSCKRQRHSPLLSQVQQQFLSRQQQQQQPPHGFYPSMPSWIHSTRMSSCGTPVVAPAPALAQTSHHHYHNMVHKIAPATPVHYRANDVFQQFAPHSPPYPYVAPSPSSPPLPLSPQKQQQQPLPPTQNINHLLVSLERTTMAIQLISSLSPVEREAVNYYLGQGH